MDGGGSSGGMEEGGKVGGRLSGFPCLRMHVHEFCIVCATACVGSWVLAAQGFDVLMRRGAHCRRGS